MGVAATAGSSRVPFGDAAQWLQLVPMPLSLRATPGTVRWRSDRLRTAATRLRHASAAAPYQPAAHRANSGQRCVITPPASGAELLRCTNRIKATASSCCSHSARADARDVGDDVERRIFDVARIARKDTASSCCCHSAQAGGRDVGDDV
jgi:hypothetical protein